MGAVSLQSVKGWGEGWEVKLLLAKTQRCAAWLLRDQIPWPQGFSTAGFSSSFNLVSVSEIFFLLPPPHPNSLKALSRNAAERAGWMYVSPAGLHSSGFHLCLLLLFYGSVFLWLKFLSFSPSPCFSSLFPFIAIFLSCFFAYVFFVWI